MAGMLPPITASLPLETSSLTDWYSISASEATRSVPASDIITSTSTIGTYMNIPPTQIAGDAGGAGDIGYARGLASNGLLPYAVLYFFWTVLVVAGLFGIWRHRERKATKIRDWRAITVAVAAIHLLFTACLIATWIPQDVNCDVVFWQVNLLVPACLAAFQIPNARLVSYYLANRSSGMGVQRHIGGNRVWCYWKNLTVVERTYFTVTVGLVLQLFFTAFMYFGSRRFHHQYGLWGHRTDAKMCMFGFEWIASILWQMVWAYGTGIFLMRAIRNVKDIYHWALETRIVIIASMPGPLLWMVFMFADGPRIRAVNNNWPPRNWLIPGLAIIQAVLISFPLYDACRAEAKDNAARLHNAPYGLGSGIEDMINTIDHHAESLIDYAASTRFNAELIIFLRDVKKWRTTWTSPDHDWVTPNTPEERATCYKHAALIYFKLVHPRSAAFAINIDGSTRSALDEKFKYARYVGGGRPSMNSRNSMGAWNPLSSASSVNFTRTSPLAIRGLEITLADAEASITLISPESIDASDDDIDDATTEGINLANRAREDAPEVFSLRIFDEAYKEVKQEAYHNIWLPYFQTR